MGNLDLLESVGEFNKYLSIVPNGCIFIANELREDSKEKGIQGILDFTEGVQWLMDAASVYKKYNIEANYDFSQIIEYLDEINEALLNQDYNLVADLFEYEIAEFFANIEKISC